VSEAGLLDSYTAVRRAVGCDHRTITTGARQKAARELPGSSTVTWQSNDPGFRDSSGILNRMGTAFDWGFRPSARWSR
jgi:hypothetical protein